MYSRSILLPLAAASVYATGALAQMDPDSTCLSYGIDFVSGGNYFINTLSNASFTAVTEFSGCNNDTADILLADPNGDEYDCTDLPTVPNDTPEMTTCQIAKNQMFSGEWSLVLLGNNGNGNPFAYQREFYLECGPQATSTVTPTAYFTETVTPTTNVTITSVVPITSTISAKTTIVKPSKTAIVTVTPKPVTTSSVKTIARTVRKWTKTAVVKTTTVTASCTVPPKPQQPDPTCRIVPKIKALPAGIHIGGAKRDESMKLDPVAIRRRIDERRARRAAAIDERDMVKRSADAPTITITATEAVNVTTTQTAPTTTLTNEVVSTKTVLTTLAPPTIVSGVAKSTKTAATPTVTAYKVTYTRTTVTRTMTAFWTYTTTVAPSASVTACKKKGGHFGKGWAGKGW